MVHLTRCSEQKSYYYYSVEAGINGTRSTALKLPSPPAVKPQKLNHKINGKERSDRKAKF